MIGSKIMWGGGGSIILFVRERVTREDSILYTILFIISNQPPVTKR